MTDTDRRPDRRVGPPARATMRAHLDTLLARGQRIVIVSNRGPLRFRRVADGWRLARGSGGLITALAALGAIAPISWVCTAVDEGDRAAARTLATGGRAAHALREAIAAELPDQDLELHLAEQPDDIYSAYYATVANPLLWFIQHEMYARPYEPNIDARLVRAWRDGYRIVNERLADRALTIVGRRRPLVLLQDYHLYLSAARIREVRPESLLLHFTHIPWPPPPTWQLLPQAMRRAICEGLLANDIVGFQIDRYAGQFLLSVDAFVRDARVDPDGRNVRWRGRTISVRTYPISLDPAFLRRFAGGERVARRRAELARALRHAGEPLVIVRADRLEPSKNVLRGFLAFEALLQRRPELKERVRFVSVTARSRQRLAEYRSYAESVDAIVARINDGRPASDPLVRVVDGSDYAAVIAALQLADVVLANPVVDGMNLVAKEAALVGRATLVLSETAGAAEQLGEDALLVAPADIVGTAASLERALFMDAEERAARLRRLRASVEREDLAWWLARQLRDLAAVAEGRRPPSRQLRDEVRRVEPELPA